MVGRDVLTAERSETAEGRAPPNGKPDSNRNAKATQKEKAEATTIRLFEHSIIRLLIYSDYSTIRKFAY